MASADNRQIEAAGSKPQSPPGDAARSLTPFAGQCDEQRTTPTSEQSWPMLGKLALSDEPMIQLRGEAARRARRTFRRWMLKVWPKGGSAPAPCSLAWRFGVATLEVALPLIVVTLVMVGWIAHSERQAKEALLAREAHTLADAVALQIDRYSVLSSALSRSRLLQRADLAGFEQQARDVLADRPELTLLVSAADGRPLLSVPRAAEHSPIWRDRARLIRQALESGSAFVSDVSADAVSREAHASIETPVLRDGDPIYEIALVFADRVRRPARRSKTARRLAVRHRRSQRPLRRPVSRPNQASRNARKPAIRNAARNPTDGIVSHNSAEGR